MATYDTCSGAFNITNTNYVTSASTVEYNSIGWDPGTTVGGYATSTIQWLDTYGKDIVSYPHIPIDWTGSTISNELHVTDTDTVVSSLYSLYQIGCPTYIYSSDMANKWLMLDEWKTVSKRHRLKSNLVVVRSSRANPVNQVSPAESRALETLREMISESDFRKYLKYGFLMVRGASGDMYQIFRDRYHTKVWRGGILTEEICVRIKDDKIPPTDNVVAFMSIIQSSEEMFKSLGNRYNMLKRAA